MLQFHNANMVIVVAGCSNSGKSSYAIRWLNNARLTCRFIFDPSSEFAKKFQRRACSTVAELNAAMGTGWVIFDPHFIFPGDVERAFVMFCEWAWTMSARFPGQKALLADEIWKFCSPNFVPKPLALIVQDGRKHGIGLICTTHRPNRLNELIMGEATEFVGFHLSGSNKLDYLKRNCDEFPIDDLPKLPLLHYVAQNLQTGGIFRGALKF